MAVELTAKQQRFVEEYVVDLNATQAAIRAGYSPKAAKVTASRMLTKANIAAAVEKLQTRTREKTELNEAWVLDNLREIVERCMQHAPVLDRKGKQVYVETPNGDVAPAFTFNALGAARAAELVGKHLGLFIERKQVDVRQTITHVAVSEADRRIEGLLAGRKDRDTAPALPH